MIKGQSIIKAIPYTHTTTNRQTGDIIMYFQGKAKHFQTNVQQRRYYNIKTSQSVIKVYLDSRTSNSFILGPIDFFDITSKGRAL